MRDGGGGEGCKGRRRNRQCLLIDVCLRDVVRACARVRAREPGSDSCEVGLFIQHSCLDVLQGEQVQSDSELALFKLRGRACARRASVVGCVYGRRRRERHRGIHCWPDTDRAEGVNMSALDLKRPPKKKGSFSITAA